MANKDGQLMRRLFNQLEEEHHFQIEKILVEKLQQDLADWWLRGECLAAIHSTYNTSGYILDPHTAVAKSSCRQNARQNLPSDCILQLITLQVCTCYHAGFKDQRNQPDFIKSSLLTKFIQCLTHHMRLY